MTRVLTILICFAVFMDIPVFAAEVSQPERVPVVNSLQRGQSLVRASLDGVYHFELCTTNFTTPNGNGLMTLQKLVETLKQTSNCEVISPKFLETDLESAREIDVAFEADLTQSLKHDKWLVNSGFVAATVISAALAGMYGYFVATDKVPNRVNRVGASIFFASTVVAIILDSAFIWNKPADTIEMSLKKLDPRLPAEASDSLFGSMVDSVKSATKYVFEKNHSA